MSEEHPHTMTLPTITLVGAWQGAVGDPARTFQGRVTKSAHPEVAVSRPAQVTFESSAQRISGAGEHGTYVLMVGPSRVPLMSFTCRSAGTTGPTGHDDMLEAEWQAVPLHGRE